MYILFLANTSERKVMKNYNQFLLILDNILNVSNLEENTLNKTIKLLQIWYINVEFTIKSEKNVITQ